MSVLIDLESLPDAALITDPAGLITAWNHRAQDVFGFSAREAIGQSLDLIIPEKFRARHWQGWNAALSAGHSTYGTTLLKVPALHQKGQALSIAFSIGFIFDPDHKEVQQVVAILRDETTRFNEEKKLRQRLLELGAENNLK